MLDKAIQPDQVLAFHPAVSDATVFVHGKDLVAFFAQNAIEPTVYEFAAVSGKFAPTH